MINIESKPKRSLFRRKPLSIFALIVALISSTYASTITMNNGSPFEWGQGVFQIKVCDTWVGVNTVGVWMSGTVNGYNYGTGNSYVGQIQVIGLDVTACNATNLQLSLYTTGSSTPLTLFKDANGNQNKVTLAINTSYYAGGPKGQVQLITPSGLLTRNDGGYERIVPEQPGGTFNGVYDIIFSTPLALSSQVNSLGLQSTKQ
jgi:hypothetical protein